LRSAFTALHERGGELLKKLWDGLHAIDGVTVFGPDPNAPRTPTVSFIVRDIPAIDVTRALVERGVFTSHGDFYAATVVARLGKEKDGLVRAGCACYTTEEEVERLLEGVRQIAAR
jgi:selenocysteine lyase/cysteine desulfurase